MKTRFSFFRWTPYYAADDGSGAPNEPDNGGTPGNPAEPPAGGNPPAPAPAGRSFDDWLASGFQAEFDRRVNKAITTAQSKWTDPNVATLQAQITGYQRRDEVIAAGVDARFAKFVASEVGESMKEGETFTDKLKTYVEQNPQFLSGGAPAGSWGHQQHGSGNQNQLSGVEAAFYALNPTLKKPE